MARRAKLLLVGEADVGKTHYGAQLLGRLDRNDCALKLTGAPTSIGPFQSALERISLGLAADHTPSNVYSESVWPIAEEDGSRASLIWPDYSGEQVNNLIDTKRLPFAWRDRILESSGWIVLLRPSRMALPNDALTRSQAQTTDEADRPVRLSPQARLVELLQLLLFVKSAASDHRDPAPPAVFLLSCYDELETSVGPADYLSSRLPLIDQFMKSNWPAEWRRSFALSSLGQPLAKDAADPAFADAGPDRFGYVIDDAGVKSADLTLPLQWLMSHVRDS